MNKLIYNTLSIMDFHHSGFNTPEDIINLLKEFDNIPKKDYISSGFFDYWDEDIYSYILNNVADIAELYLDDNYTNQLELLYAIADSKNEPYKYRDIAYKVVNTVVDYIVTIIKFDNSLIYKYLEAKYGREIEKTTKSL